MFPGPMFPRARILEQVTIIRRLLIGRDRNLFENTGPVSMFPSLYVARFYFPLSLCSPVPMFPNPSSAPVQSQFTQSEIACRKSHGEVKMQSLCSPVRLPSKPPRPTTIDPRPTTPRPTTPSTLNPSTHNPSTHNLGQSEIFFFYKSQVM